MTRRLVAMESSTARCSLALFEGSTLVAEEAPETPGPSAGALVSLLDALMARAGWGPAEVARWAVGVGPGSFTGVRVGVATAKGIALATGAELVGVTSLEALAFGVAIPAKAVLASVVPAGKGELFLMVSGGAGQLLVGPTPVPLGETAARVAAAAAGADVTVVGSAAHDVDWSPLGAPVRILAEPPHDRPRATSVGRIALGRPPEDADRLEAVYVRDPEITIPKTPTLSPGPRRGGGE
jgi:tRNA threonylcarbamoyladenosine biosynthesis protein TsaB